MPFITEICLRYEVFPFAKGTEMSLEVDRIGDTGLATKYSPLRMGLK